MNRETSTALVLAGGGALGAYEAGALRYILDTLPRELGRPVRFNLFAGTSVGALNCSILAAHAEDLPRAARSLADFWKTITFDKIVRFGGSELTNLTKLILGRTPGSGFFTGRGAPAPAGAPHHPVAGFFDTTPLGHLVRELIPWTKLQLNLEREAVRGIALCATEICTGTSIIFYQTSKSTEYRPGRDPSKEARPVRIDAQHAMASAAIPFLFPTVQVKGVCYTDGALRQNTPLNPALRMGAERLLVISITQSPMVASHLARLGCRLNPFPGALFLLGRTVKVFLTQSLDYELNRVEMYNRLIEGGSELYGEGFIDDLNRMMGQVRNATYRPVRTCHIRPSRNLDRMAQLALREAPSELCLPGIPGKFVSKLMGSESFAESELLSFLLFTPTFIRALLDLGYHDAQMQREQLVQLFS